MSESLDIRNYSELNNAIALAQHTVYKQYLSELGQYPVVQPSEILLDDTAENCIRFFHLEELSCRRGEDIFQKLSTVYHASMSLGCNLIVLIDVEKIEAPAKIYMGVRKKEEDIDTMASLGTSFRTLKNGMKSNFAGTKFKDVPSQNEMPQLVREIFGEENKYISSVSCVASVRDKSKTENKTFVQGLERFIDAMRGNAYTAMFIAEPVTEQEQITIRNGYESLYSTLSAFRKSIWSYNENESEAVMESLSDGISQSVTDGTSHTQAHTWNAGVNVGVGVSASDSTSLGQNTGTAESHPSGVARAGQVVSGAAALVGRAGRLVPNPQIQAAIKAGTVALGVVGGIMQGGSKSQSSAESITNTIGKTLGLSGGLNGGYARTTSDTELHSDTEMKSTTKTAGTTKTGGTGKTLQIEHVNKSIEEMLKRIEEQLKRMQEGEDYGAYSCGAYFLSGRHESSLLAANTYRALMLGEGSAVENSAINSWNGVKDPDTVGAIKQYLSRFVHPVFAMPVVDTSNNITDLVTYTPATIVSGMELPLHLGLPTKSVYGLAVLEHAEFGRNVVDKGISENTRGIKIGKIYHMGQTEKKSGVELNVEGLSAHTFITGSTGSGKSNTIYKMLDCLNQQEVNFLVVESAKGEYKNSDVFGGRLDVSVFGTSPKIDGMQMLRLNPFSFPASTHVLEHMDRLVEIFNVCWPMYAAMPAILKDAIQRAYEMAGWDMETSENRYNNQLFPSFVDVYQQIRQVLEESEYSQDNKNDYTGSLVTRLRSLTNGINGLIFSPDEIQPEVLFDSNVIVDLSRVGSTETKALIMGLLVLKLQEHRMERPEPNQSLHHVTVLEEAHNLLRRTSAEQSSENSNLLGKAVEMLANSIAEMRTYGEGFIIADQSPGLLDMSVIRNTNTKIILRLPDYSDRELVGRAAGLDNEQIMELAKLDKGVAAVSQSEWLQPVLCRIDKYKAADRGYGGEKEDVLKSDVFVKTDEVSRAILDFIMNKELYRKGDRVDIQKLKDVVIRSKLDVVVKCEFLEYLSADARNVSECLRKLVYDFFKAEKAIAGAEGFSDVSEWANAVAQGLTPSVSEYSKQQIDSLIALIVNEKAERDVTYHSLFRRITELYQQQGRIL